MVALRQPGLLQQIGLLQRLQHSLANLGHQVEPLVVGADRLMLGVIEQPAFLIVDDAIELGENGAHFGRGLERQIAGVERADQQHGAGSRFGQQLGESAAGRGDGTGNEHATFRRGSIDG